MLLTSHTSTWYRITRALPLAVMLLWPLHAWAGDLFPPSVDRAAMHRAVTRGTAWLEKHAWQQPGGKPDGLDRVTRQAIVIKALGRRVARGKNDHVDAWMKALRNTPPATTREVALRVPAIAYAFENPIRRRNVLLPYAIFLIDNQAKDGSWGTGRAVAAPHASMFMPEPTMSGYRARQALSRTLIKRRAWGEPGDVLHTGHAMLGWWTCLQCGIVPDWSAMALTETWLTKAQNEDGGWGRRKGEPSRYTTTALGMTGLSVCLAAQSRSPTRVIRDIRIQKAGLWLGDHLKYGKMKGSDSLSRWFWLSCAQNAGECSGLVWFGQVPWYEEGANWLVSTQHEDGSWGENDKDEGRILDTCWAMQLLNRRIMLLD